MNSIRLCLFFQMKYTDAYTQENEQYKVVFVLSDEVHRCLHPGE